jgi:hypothetical protein
MRVSRRGVRLLLVLGLALTVAGGYFFTHLNNDTTSHFAPSSKLEHALTNGTRVVGSSAFPKCPASVNRGSIAVDQIDTFSTPSKDKTNFTIYAGNQIQVELSANYLPTNLFCLVPQSTLTLDYDTLDAVRPGTNLILITDSNHHVEVFKVTVLNSQFDDFLAHLLLGAGLPLVVVALFLSRSLRRANQPSGRPDEQPQYVHTWS